MQTNLFTNSSSTSNTTGDAIASQSTSTQDLFTKLLVAQIKNQDPLAPTDPSQFVNQLTQQSQTEALQNLASLTNANTSVLQSMQVLSLGGQVGSEVMVETNTVSVKGTDAISGNISLAASSAATTVVLTGSNGVEHKIDLGAQSAGTIPFSIDPAALGLTDGKYSIAVTTSTAEKPTVDIAGRLNSVRLLGNGGLTLNVSNLGDVDPSVVTGFNGVKKS